MQEFSKNARQYRQSIILGALAGMSLAITFAAGFFFRGFVDLPSALASTSLPITSGTSRYPLLDEVQVLLDKYYLRTQPPEKEREYAVVRGLLTSLNDRFTFFIDPPVAKSESDVLAGTYGGIGVLIQRAESGDLLLYPFEDSPAEKAGIEDGDVLLAVNKTSVSPDMQMDAIDQMLRGEVKESNGVEITARKRANAQIITRFIPFAVINVPSIIWRLLPENQQIGYLQILRFTSRTPEELKAGLQELRKSQIRSLILDIRNNSGGLLQESVTVASQFLDGGIIVYEKTNLGERSLSADTGGVATDLPLVVLVNKGTASAAELVAGAIQDRKRGILIGQTTFGKGTVQQIFRLSDSSSLHITSAEWLTPNRYQLDSEGLKPNIIMIPDINGRDVELGEAIRQLANTAPK